MTKRGQLFVEGHSGEWGPWRLDPEGPRALPVAPYRYEVDLDTCTTRAEVLDWICQVAGKTWADDATVAGLVRALNDVLAPQATCARPAGPSGSAGAASPSGSARPLPTREAP